MDIVLVHGYNVTSTSTYGHLPARLKEAGHAVKNVYLAKYVTLDNEVTLGDVVAGMQAALEDLYGANLAKKRFACVTHSTGGLVARAWIAEHYAKDIDACPMSHLIMLAPPNHGSRLATLGKSRLSRLRGYFGVEPGLRILDALELGSAAQREVDLVWMEKKLHAAPRFFPAVISGQYIDPKLWDVVVPATREPGSDGVVRLASANLNTRRFSIAASGSGLQVMGGNFFFVPPRAAHSDEFGVMKGIPRRGDHPVWEAIQDLLSVTTRRRYQLLEAAYAVKTFAAQRRARDLDNVSMPRFGQIAFRITDDRGHAPDDYVIEFFDDARPDVPFRVSEIVHKHKNDRSPNHLLFYICADGLARHLKGGLGFRVSSVTESPLITYPTTVFSETKAGLGRLLQTNETTWVDVVVRRRINKNVFRLTTNLAKQRIEGKSGTDWIE